MASDEKCGRTLHSQGHAILMIPIDPGAFSAAGHALVELGRIQSDFGGVALQCRPQSNRSAGNKSCPPLPRTFPARPRTRRLPPCARKRMDVGQGELAEYEANLVGIFGANLARHRFLAAAHGTFEIAKLHHRHGGVGIARRRGCQADQSVARWFQRGRWGRGRHFPMRGELIETRNADHQRRNPHCEITAQLGQSARADRLPGRGEPRCRWPARRARS